MRSPTRSLCASLASSAAVGALLLAKPAHAQIKEPGSHPRYTVELEPHFVLQWTYADWDSDGLGVGGRVSIPVMDNGPVTTINNSLAVGVGLDWAHFGGTCNATFRINNRPVGADCTANHFWIPVVAQWNFWFTPVVSAFAELGFAIQHASFDESCGPGVPAPCGLSDSYTRARPVFLVGPRFTLSNVFAITLRIGIPYLTIGGSFYL